MADKKKIVVIGGGCGALSAVWGITSAPDWREHYEIDVYQLGWRLGGKGAAGRNRSMGDRIEEHGLHMWFGFYQNAFKMIREAYTELHTLRPSWTYPSWREAFTPRVDLYLEEYVEGHWERWHTAFAANKEEPGDGHPIQSLGTFLVEAIEWGIELLFGADVLDWLEKHFRPFEPTAESRAARHSLAGGLLGGLLHDLASDLEAHVAALVGRSSLGTELQGHLADARRLAKKSVESPDAMQALIALLRPIASWLTDALEQDLERHTELRRAFILVDLGLSLMVGLVADGCLAARSLAPIERYDWMEWLAKNGATRLCLESPWVRGLYDGPFAFARGDASRPSLSAAVAVRGQLRGFVGYKGAPMWMMNAGMGDTIFAPLYLVLAARGVRFHFFHKARELAFDRDLTRIERVRFGVQATVKGGAEYAPLFPLGSMEVWPSTPRYEQLVEGTALEAHDVDLESSWTDWQDVGEKVLVRGVDFDVVIGGMSLAAWPYAAPALFEGESATAIKWRAMRDGLPAIATQAVQLWLTKSSSELGFTDPGGIIGGYAQPFNTWADLSPLLESEHWTGADAPKALVYLCGPLREPRVIPPFDDVGYPRRQRERVADTGADWLSANGGYPWPRGAPVNEPASLDPALLAAPASLRGLDRIDAMYSRANVEPTERYVLSPPSSAALRVKADGSSIEGLYLAGDWLSTGLDSGCVEGAVVGGLEASRAISGFPATIIGYEDSW